MKKGKLQRQVLHNCFASAKENFKNGNRDKARDFIDYGIGFVAAKRRAGYKIDDTIEDVRVGLWLERFWNFLENNNLMLA